MTAQKLLADLKKGIVAPCYLLYGGEEFLIGETLNRMLDILVLPADRDFSLFYLDDETTDLDVLAGHVLSPSLLGSRKVVVVRNTGIFTSSENLADLIEKIRSNREENPQRAVKWFLTFLKLAGLKREDMINDGWRKITDDQWHNIVETDFGDDREKWLPQVIDLAISLGWTEGDETDNIQQLGEIFLKGLPAGNCVIFTAQTADKRKKIFKIIEETGIVLHFGELKSEALLKETLKQEAQELLASSGKNLTPGAWVALGRKTGFQLRGTLNELQKLVLFVGEKTNIDEKDVDYVVGKTKEDSIFELTAALSEKNQLAALAALKALLDQGVHYLVILSMISREIRLLIKAKVLEGTGKMPKITGSMDYGWFQKNVYPLLKEPAGTKAKQNDSLVKKHPYVIFNALRNCGRFSFPVLEGFLDDLLEMDLAMKSSAADPRLLLENFLVKACAKAS